MSQRFCFRLAAAAGVIVAGMLGGGAVRAQDAMLHAPKVLVIVREDVKPGKGGSLHVKAEEQFVRAFKKAKSENYIAATTTTGGSSAFFFSAYDSFAAWEKDTQTVDKNAGADIDLASQRDGELLTASHTMTATLRSDLSYLKDHPLKGLRYFVMYTVRVRPGHEDEFVEARKRARAAHEQASLADGFSVYQVNSGAPAGTFIFFVPMNSLAEMDEFVTIHNGKAYQDALGEDGQKALREFDRNGQLGAESILISLSPKMSYAPKAFVDADPGFWTPKPAATGKAAAAKKEGEKK
jgi:hypothetical protein